MSRVPIPLTLTPGKKTIRFREITSLQACLPWQTMSFIVTLKVMASDLENVNFATVSLQTDNSTRSSDAVKLARPFPASSLKVTDRSFQHASPHLWNKLPFSLREPVSPLYAYLNPSFCSPLSPSITPSLFQSKLKTNFFGKSFPPQISYHRHFGLTSSANGTVFTRT